MVSLLNNNSPQLQLSTTIGNLLPTTSEVEKGEGRGSLKLASFGEIQSFGRRYSLPNWVSLHFPLCAPPLDSSSNSSSDPDSTPNCKLISITISNSISTLLPIPVPRFRIAFSNFLVLGSSSQRNENRNRKRKRKQDQCQSQKRILNCIWRELHLTALYLYEIRAF